MRRRAEAIAVVAQKGRGDSATKADIGWLTRVNGIHVAITTAGFAALLFEQGGQVP